METIRRDLRFLKIYAGLSTLALVLVAAAAFGQASPAKQTFGEIDVERINVVEPDGRVRLVIAGSARQAVTVIDGRQILPHRQRDAGLMFFNDEGDEDGGMTWTGRTENGDVRADAGLSFDQYKQDETVTLRYAQQGADRTAGLTVADRPEASLGVAVRLNDATTDAERAKVRQELVDSGALGSHPRMFAGKHADGTATVALSDGAGKPRLVLSVEKSGAAKLEFLDANGKVTRAIRP